MLALAVFLTGFCGTTAYYGRRTEIEFNLNETSLENYQVNARAVSEVDYPWIARVVHSRTASVPHVCTASCIEQRIFITALRCIYGLKVNMTSIIYQQSRLATRAFVLPSNGTKQGYDDIGVIVVEPGFHGIWKTVQIIEQKRTDDGFKWFADLDLSYGPHEHKVVGYAALKGLHKIKTPDRHYHLTELPVTVSINICHTILTFNHHIKGFYVPCYHSCNLHEFKFNDEKCKNYHGVEGGAVIEVSTQKLLGVATWGPYFHSYELPVGFSVPNSDNFYMDLQCARRIRDDNSELVTRGHYQMLCK